MASIYMRLFSLFLMGVMLFVRPVAWADPSDRETIAELIVPPFSLGDPINDKGVWTLLNSGDAEAGYVIETEPLAPLPGFSGAPINALVTLDLNGTFMDVRLIEHNEPIFVSGLGQAPFHKFFEQYRGLSISSSLVVGTPYGQKSGDSSSLVYLDGVTKATASVRIAHESVLAATLSVVRDKMQGIQSGPPAFPDPDYEESLTWDDLLASNLVTHKRVLNSDVQAEFADSLWEFDDAQALDDPSGVYLDLWVVDLGPPSIAKAVLSEESYATIQEFLSISQDDEPLLLIDTGRHGLVSESFVRNTAPDWLTAEQNGLPVALRDADLLIDLHPDLPEELHDGTFMLLRTDRRLGFDPSQPWELHVKSVREHGMFRPEIGSVSLTAQHQTDARFFKRPDPEITAQMQVPPWKEAIRNRQTDMLIVTIALTALFVMMLMRMSLLASPDILTPFRMGSLLFTLVFIGWWGQGQLSIVTVLGVIRTLYEGGSLAFLAYDPFSLVVWAFALVGMVIWGRGLFCGWLCPFGVLQEYAYRLGRKLKLPQIQVSARWDSWLIKLKYVVLAGLIATVFIVPDQIDKAAEIEPFKTAITVFFIREWYYALYALSWLVLGLFFFKGFCRYVCPLGAFFALGGLLRRWNWIERRAECGTPCQLCKARCLYKAIKPQGEIIYSECFQCLDCVSIYEDDKQCVPEILKARGRPLQEKPA